MTLAVRPPPKRIKCYEKVGDTLNEYRRIRDVMRATRSRRKCEECCAALDVLWRRLSSKQRTKLSAEFTAHETLK